MHANLFCYELPALYACHHVSFRLAASTKPSAYHSNCHAYTGTFIHIEERLRERFQHSAFTHSLASCARHKLTSPLHDSTSIGLCQHTHHTVFSYILIYSACGLVGRWVERSGSHSIDVVLPASCTGDAPRKDVRETNSSLLLISCLLLIAC